MYKNNLKVSIPLQKQMSSVHIYMIILYAFLYTYTAVDIGPTADNNS